MKAEQTSKRKSLCLVLGLLSFAVVFTVVVPRTVDASPAAPKAGAVSVCLSVFSRPPEIPVHKPHNETATPAKPSNQATHLVEKFEAAFSTGNYVTSYDLSKLIDSTLSPSITKIVNQLQYLTRENGELSMDHEINELISSSEIATEAHTKLDSKIKTGRPLLFAKLKQRSELLLARRIEACALQSAICSERIARKSQAMKVHVFGVEAARKELEQDFTFLTEVANYLSTPHLNTRSLNEHLLERVIDEIVTKQNDIITFIAQIDEHLALLSSHMKAASLTLDSANLNARLFAHADSRLPEFTPEVLSVMHLSNRASETPMTVQEIEIVERFRRLPNLPGASLKAWLKATKELHAIKHPRATRELVRLSSTLDFSRSRDDSPRGAFENAMSGRNYDPMLLNVISLQRRPKPVDKLIYESLVGNDRSSATNSIAIVFYARTWGYKSVLEGRTLTKDDLPVLRDLLFERITGVRFDNSYQNWEAVDVLARIATPETVSLIDESIAALPEVRDKAKRLATFAELRKNILMHIAEHGPQSLAEPLSYTPSRSSNEWVPVTIVPRAGGAKQSKGTVKFF